MDLSKPIEIIWYENTAGEKWVPPPGYNGMPEPPEGFFYQHSQFPTQLHHSVLKMVQASEVEACEHPHKHVRPTGGWIEGVEGRECKQCCGTQTKNTGEAWATKWDAYGSREIMSGSSGWSEELALALCTAQETPGDWKLPEKMTLSHAIQLSATACERCMNVLAHGVGLSWGYAKDSEDWKKSGTSCDLCENLTLKSV